MKMNLSVVMGMKDKISAPLKGIASESDRYAKQIRKVQKAQADDTAALGMIASFKSSNKAINKNALAIAATNEKLTQLKAQSASATRPSAALTEKISKQQAKLDKLDAEQTHYKNNLVKLGKKLNQAGVNMDDLEGESDRLNRSYKKHGQEIARLSKKYSILQTAMKPVQKLNRAIRLPNIASAAVGKGAALLGGLSLAGLASEVNRTAAEMDNLAKTVRTLNLPIEELQAMQSQANHAGVESEALSGSMRRFTKRLGVLQQTGTGALGSFLKKSGSALYEDLQDAKDTQHAYQMLLDAFSKLESPQEQMAFADAAFGREGRKMLIMLREGTQGLTAARKELYALGGGATAQDAAKAEAYNDALQKIQESVRSIKFAVLAPVMEKVTKVFTRFSDKFKNAQWRTEFINKLIQTVDGLYQGFTLLSKGLIWVVQNFKGLIAALAIFKVAMIGLNAVIMANPFGMIVTAIGAAVIAITYLVDKFIGLDNVIKWVGEKIAWLWDKFKALINKLPDSLIPEGWKIETDAAGKQVDKLANKLEGIKDKNAKLGITTEETTHRRETTSSQYHAYQAGNLTTPKPYQAYQPLTSQTLKSKSEVELRIKSEKPVTVDKAKSEKGTELSLDVGDMGWSY